MVTKVTNDVLADDAVATNNIANAAITGTKIANGTITSTNLASGAITATAIANNSIDGTKIALGSDARGDIMFYNGTDWARLAAGTSGYFLKTQGAGADPIWAAEAASSWGGTESATANGYVTFPAGITLQWGRETAAGANSTTITFPKAFTIACWSINLTDVNPGDTAGVGTVPAVSSGPTLTNFVVSSFSRDFFWMAIGK